MLYVLTKSSFIYLSQDKSERGSIILELNNTLIRPPYFFISP